MWQTLKAMVLFIFAALVAGAVWLYSGAYDAGADAPHWPLTVMVVEMARERSIDTRAVLITPPTDLADPARLRRGAGNYDAMCVGCHLKPGLGPTELSRALYPPPPDFTAAAGDEDAAAAFWVIKHGIKASGMPAWSVAGVDDETIWDMVALIDKLATMTGHDYHELVESSEGHSHDANAADNDSDADAAEPEAPHEHEHHHAAPHD